MPPHVLLLDSPCSLAPPAPAPANELSAVETTL